MSVCDVIQIISFLDSNKQRVGNNDAKFESIADVHKGVFKDVTGNRMCLSVCLIMCVFVCV